MTKWQEFPLRPQGRPWVGINTRSGKLDDGTGQMTDDSINCIINQADRLQKRKGFVRGLDERFAGTVCGLHSYTDECGREWLLVADEEGISIRQPFAVPVFRSSDAYPNDDFQADGPVNKTWWQNTAPYTQSGGALVLVEATTAGGDLRWFKDAANFSYQLEASWTTAVDSRVVAAMKIGDVARIEGRIVNSAGSVSAALVWVDAEGNENVLAASNLPLGTETGTFLLSYSRNTGKNVYTATMIAQPANGSAVQLQDFQSINAVADADLGQGSALRLEAVSEIPSIAMIAGESL